MVWKETLGQAIHVGVHVTRATNLNITVDQVHPFMVMVWKWSHSAEQCALPHSTHYLKTV